MNFKRLATHILNLNEEKKYLHILKESPDDVELRIGLMSLYIKEEKYDKALKQYEVIRQSNYDGKRKNELENNLKMLELTKNKPAPLESLETALLGTALAIFILLPNNSYCDGKEENKPKSIFEPKSAYAMPVIEKPALNAPAPSTTQFTNYLNAPVYSRYDEKGPTREEFEKVPVYRGYYIVNDKKRS